MLHINPGAAGISGFHKVRTLVRFCIDNGEFKDLEVIELAAPGLLVNCPRWTNATVPAIRNRLYRAYSSLSATGCIPVSYTHLDVYKRQQ